MGAKNGIEFKIKSHSNYPFIRIQFKIGTKTLVTKQPLNKLLSLGSTVSSTEAIEFLCKFEIENRHEPIAKNKSNLDVSDLISEFSESNQIRMSVRKVPVTTGKNLRNLSAIQTKYISNNHANGSSPVKIKKEK